MKDLSVKQGVLKDIIELMEGREAEGLKSHPKIAKKEEDAPIAGVISVENEKPLEKIGAEGEGKEDEDEVSPEDLQMLLAKIKEMQ